jgi:hypothetical protein
VILKIDVRSFCASYSQFLVANELNVADLVDAKIGKPDGGHHERCQSEGLYSRWQNEFR